MNEETKRQLAEFNRQFGLETQFITDTDVLGYAQGNTIFINESIEHDYERTNKHELLHFFEDTDSFQEIKDEVLTGLGDQLQNVRREYRYRYAGLYSEDEISAGIIDTEIAIDLMVDNSTIQYDRGLQIGDRTLGKIKNELVRRRFLNQSISRNIQNLGLTPWEQIFASNYYDGKSHAMPQRDRQNNIRRDILSEQERLFGLGEENFRIRADSPAIAREYENEIKALEARGEPTHSLVSNPAGAKEYLAESHSKTLYEEYRYIVDSVSTKDYEPAFIVSMLRETLSKTYKLDQEKDGTGSAAKTIVNKRIMDESIDGHMVLNEQTLDFIYSHAEDMAEYKNFPNLYFAALAVHSHTIAEKSAIALDGVETYGKGRWIKFEGMTSDEENYLKNAKDLAALVQDTPWCTRTLAASHLSEGDFFVFVDQQNKPHIAVKMLGNKIDEVRGIKNGNAQELENDYRDVAVSFLTRNKDLENGKEWLEKEQWNKRLISYIDKIKSDSFKTVDMESFFKDLGRPDFRSHGMENTHITTLKSLVSQRKPSFVNAVKEYFNCSEEEICFGSTTQSYSDDSALPYKVILGDIDVSRGNGRWRNIGPFSLQSLGNIEFIMGNCRISRYTESIPNLKYVGGTMNIFANDRIKSLNSLEYIGGNLIISDSSINDFGNLKFIGGDLRANASEHLSSLGSLKYVGGSVWLEWAKIESLGNLEHIDGNLNLGESNIKTLGNLINVKGSVFLERTSIENLGNLESVGNEFFLETNNTLKSLGKLKRVGGCVCVQNSILEDTGNLTKVGGDFYAGHTKHLKSLGLIEDIDGTLDITDSQIEDMGAVKRVGENLDANGTECLKSLGKLESVHTVYLDQSNIQNLGVLKDVNGDLVLSKTQYLRSLGNIENVHGGVFMEESNISDLGNLKYVEDDLFASQTKNLKSLGNITDIGADLDLDGSGIEDLGNLKHVEWHLSLSDTKNLVSLGRLEHVGGGLDLSGSNVEDLGNLKSVGWNVNIEDAENLKTLGGLENVGGSLDGTESNIEDLGNLKHIGKSLNLRETKHLESLGCLESVGSDLLLEGSAVKDLGALKTVKGNVGIDDTPNLKTLGNLEEIHRGLYAANSNLENLGALSSVGGTLRLENTNVNDFSTLQSVKSSNLNIDGTIYCSLESLQRAYSKQPKMNHALYIGREMNSAKKQLADIDLNKENRCSAIERQ